MLATLVLVATLSAAPAENSEEPKLDLVVEQAAREFRIAVYEEYRETRDVYDSRRALGDELLRLWNKAEQPSRHREGVLAWFGEAVRQTRSRQDLLPYAQLDDLRTTTVSEELLEGEAEGAEAKGIQDTPPFVLETPPGAVEPTEDESFWTRIKALFSAVFKSAAEAKPADEPKPAE